MGKEFIKLAVIGLMLGSCVSSCSNQSERSVDTECDESNCEDKGGCRRGGPCNSSWTGKRKCDES